MIKEHDRVVLAGDLAGEGLEIGDVGTVVHVHTAAQAYEVEFMALDGQTEVIVTLVASQVRPVKRHEIAHAREFAVA